MQFDPIATLTLAVAVLLFGGWLNRHVGVLGQYNIPAPISGGLVFAAALAATGAAGVPAPVFDASLRGPLLLAFFATVGLGANLATLRQGGVHLLMFIALLAPFVALQNVVGVGLAWAMDQHPLVGLIGGSLTLIGGHGTGAAYAQGFIERQNLQGAVELTVTAATFGLILGGVIGGPLAQWLIGRHRIATPGTGDAADDPGVVHEPPLDAEPVILALGAVLACMLAGAWLDRHVQLGALTLPSFLWCLLSGVLVRNLGAVTGVLRLDDRAIGLLGALTLSLFLALTMMNLRLVDLLGLAGPILVILLVQTALTALYATWVAYRLMGRGYEAAVISAGFCGFTMGATATAIANMQAVIRRYGPAPEAMLIIPLTGAFFVDLLNALILTGFLTLPLFGG